MKLADKLLQLRKKSGMTQEELAHQMNVSRQSISKWEAGLSYPELDKLVQLSEIFQVSTDFLLKEEETVIPPEVHEHRIDPTPVVRWSMICAGFIGISGIWICSRLDPVNITDWTGAHYVGFSGYLSVYQLLPVLLFFIVLLITGISWNIWVMRKRKK